MNMKERESTQLPKRTDLHEALEVFVGTWRAEGWSYGKPEQKADQPKALRDKWTSTHTASWHTGKFFLRQDERAMLGSDKPIPFDTLSIMGVDPESGRWFARTYENHGFQRLYELKRDANVWTLKGAAERARIEFTDDGKNQSHTWEWLKDGKCLPLCDRVAVKEK